MCVCLLWFLFMQEILKIVYSFPVRISRRLQSLTMFYPMNFIAFWRYCGMCSLNPFRFPQPTKAHSHIPTVSFKPSPHPHLQVLFVVFFFILISLFFVTICLASPLFLFLHPDMKTISHYPHPLCLPDQLAINFKFTFNESEPELVNITKENLLIKPVSTRSDIDFELEVFQPVLLRITVYSCEFRGIFYLFLQEKKFMQECIFSFVS